MKNKSFSEEGLKDIESLFLYFHEKRLRIKY